jgi:hypothetical protein
MRRHWVVLVLVSTVAAFDARAQTVPTAVDSIAITMTGSSARRRIPISKRRVLKLSGSLASLEAFRQKAEEIGFFTMPADLTSDPTLCTTTDRRGANTTLTLYWPAGQHSVRRPNDCVSSPAAADRLARLRALESAVFTAIIRGHPSSR